MKRLKKESSVENQSGIDNLVIKLIKLYHENDYDYVVSLAKVGKKPEGLETIDDEIRFIEFNKLNSESLSDEDLKVVADIVMKKIRDIDNEIYLKYNN